MPAHYLANTTICVTCHLLDCRKSISKEIVWPHWYSIGPKLLGRPQQWTVNSNQQIFLIKDSIFSRRFFLKDSNVIKLQHMAYCYLTCLRKIYSPPPPQIHTKINRELKMISFDDIIKNYIFPMIAQSNTSEKSVRLSCLNQTILTSCNTIYMQLLLLILSSSLY